MTRARPIFHARVPGGEPAEGLAVALVGDEIAVGITLDKRTRTVVLSRIDALDLANTLRRRLAGHDRLRPVLDVVRS
jgi:hypothetical protein